VAICYVYDLGYMVIYRKGLARDIDVVECFAEADVEMPEENVQTVDRPEWASAP